MSDSKQVQAFNKALRETQRACGYIVPEDKSNPHFKSRYASLPSVLSRVMPEASRHGLTLSQHTEIRDDWTILVSVLSHDEGHSVTSEWPVAKTNEKPQAMGSALTYAKRYQTTCLFGLSADEDDDGNGANKSREENDLPPPREKPKSGGNDSNRKPAPKPNADTAKLLMAFAKKGIPADELKDYLGHEVDAISEDEVRDLRSVYKQVTDGGEMWSDILDAKMAENARKGAAA